ncbi:MAG: hypothetical protein ABI618_18420 [Nitrospirota bacterium]
MARSKDSLPKKFEGINRIAIRICDPFVRKDAGHVACFLEKKEE